MKARAELNNLRMAPRKVRLVCDFIRGLDVPEAFLQLKNTVKFSAEPVEKILKSAVANAENNFGLDRDNLYICDIQVGEGPRLKRWLPRAYGRATLILKRTSRIFIILEERVEGKNRKSKKQLEKEKKQREEEKEKMRKDFKKEKEEGKKEEKTAEPIVEKTKNQYEEEVQKNAKKGWVKKMFRRKSV